MSDLVVVGVDGSVESDAAVRWAAARVQHHGGRLRLVHAHPAPMAVPAIPFFAADPASEGDLADYLRAGEAVLKAARQVAGDRVDAAAVTTDLEPGGASAVLVDASTKADLVVVGSRGHGGFAGLLLGSVSSQLATHAHCPTVVVRGQAPSDGAVVVGVDGSEPSNAAVAFAFAEASRLGARLVAVHAWSVPLPTGPAEAAAMLSSGYDRERYEQAAQQVLAGALRPGRERYPDLPVEARTVEANAADALLAADERPAMVVVGSRGHGGFAGLLLGSTSQSVLHHASCPVAVIRPAAGD